MKPELAGLRISAICRRESAFGKIKHHAFTRVEYQTAFGRNQARNQDFHKGGADEIQPEKSYL